MTTKKRKLIYLINLSQVDFEKTKNNVEKKSKSVVKQLCFSKMESAKANSIVVAEDIISMKESEQINLRKGLNYNAHHKNQKIICVSHMIHKTSMYSMLSFFHYILFSSSKANLPLIRFTFNYFKLDKIDEWLQKFLEHGKNGKIGIYFFFDCHKMTFNVLTDIGKSEFTVLGGGETDYDEKPQQQQTPKFNRIETIAKLQIKFDKFLSHHPLSNQASSIFSIIINGIDLKNIRENDLTISFKDRFNSSKKILISLVDYITILLDENVQVSSSQFVLHKYLQKYCYIPQIFSANKHLKCNK